MNMKQLKAIIVMLIILVSLVSCKESLIPEGLTENRKITYVMTNDTDAQVSVTSIRVNGTSWCGLISNKLKLAVYFLSLIRMAL